MLVPFLPTRCLYHGVQLSSGQLGLSTILGHQMPLPAGYAWLKVSLTQRLTKYQADLMQYCFWPLDASTRGYIWAQANWTQLSTIAAVLTNTEMWKVQNATILKGWEYPVLRRKDFAKLTPNTGRLSSTFLLPPELIWGPPNARGLWHHLLFRGPIRLTNYNFLAHVQYCITIPYHSCSIDKYRNVEDVKCHNFGRLGISHVEQEGFCKTHPKHWEFPPHSFSHLSWFEVPPMLGVWNIIYLLQNLSDWQIITSMHMYSTI